METPDEHELLCSLLDIEDKWCDIGLSLKVQCNVLNDFKESGCDNCTKLKKVINIWKNTQPSPVTWKVVITAMGSHDNKMLADRICCHLKLGNLL